MYLDIYKIIWVVVGAFTNDVLKPLIIVITCQAILIILRLLYCIEEKNLKTRTVQELWLGINMWSLLPLA